MHGGICGPAFNGDVSCGVAGLVGVQCAHAADGDGAVQHVDVADGKQDEWNRMDHGGPNGDEHCGCGSSDCSRQCCCFVAWTPVQPVIAAVLMVHRI